MRSFQLKYGKIYDDFEDRFRKTVYFINKATIEDHNILFDLGLSSYSLGINRFADCFDDEFPFEHPTPAAQIVEVPTVNGRALVPATYAFPDSYTDLRRATYPVYY